MRWKKRRIERDEQRAEAMALLQVLAQCIPALVARKPDVWAEFRHGPIDKDAMRGPIPRSANSIRELDMEDRATRRCCCRGCRCRR